MTAATQAMQLKDGARVGIIGAGPAGSFTGYFLLEMAARTGLQLSVDIYDPKNFHRHGPIGCNHCGGIISESLVQALAAEGIALPDNVVQRGIDSYVLHVGEEVTHIHTPLREMRLAALHRGKGPTGCESLATSWESFDGYLLGMAMEKGAVHHPQAVTDLSWRDGFPELTCAEGTTRYDLVIGAIGVNTHSPQLFADSGLAVKAARRAPAAIAEVFIGHEQVERLFGSAMHLFMIDRPGIEFAALIPKGEYITACLLGDAVDGQSMKEFLQLPNVQRCLNIDWAKPPLSCRCLPALNIGAASPLFRDRLVLVGDCGVSRLYKDGIGAAYRASKACALTAIFHGVSAADFALHYHPTCKRMSGDNRLGVWLFRGAGLLRDWRPLRKSMLSMVRHEQEHNPADGAAMSGILWDLFTGSASYGNILRRALSLRFLCRFVAGMLRPLSSGHDES